ncbi:hemolysin family protein [Novosphingobium mangrovi (ex Huang et al. 2023)]|uniref:Hemolysin family protein n=1 Tax=Novosphingobium mangrovi (ex Huang et al. 2023) TaxID=2976432 RepID=A0ABT2I9W5_9SPHN|nr:hemolysin family protein [Novosphingobium mangrovi (ex Huang et al. 2023)]MCT2401627.1 hemolysin family protein [Novosphingobium mangrovi (ex Huang et al. 2023)]
MTPFPWTDLLIIAGLILLNGLFSMSELAIVSARAARLRVSAEKGSGAAKSALELAADPGKFLSTVQIGITLIGIIAGAYSGASLGAPVGERLAILGVPERFASEAGFTLVIIATTYASLVIGELVPKQLALRMAEPVALIMARPMAWLAKVMAPFVWLLDKSSGVLLRLLSIRGGDSEQLTAEELQMIFAEATRSGVIEEEERAMMAGVMRLADRPVRELMTPRNQIDWIDIDADEAALRAKIESSPHSLLPVADEDSPDNVEGILKVREVLAAMVEGRSVDIRAMMRKAEIIPDQLDAMDALRKLQTAEVAMAVVHDEYGHLEGIVTPSDVLEALAGSFVSHQDEGDAPMVVERADGSLLVSGAMPADAMADRLDMTLPEDREFATVAGYVLAVLKKVPREGEYFSEQGWRFEVVDMDGLRIDKILVEGLEEGNDDGVSGDG